MADLDMLQNLRMRIVILLISIDSDFLIVFALLHWFYRISRSATVNYPHYSQERDENRTV